MKNEQSNTCKVIWIIHFSFFIIHSFIIYFSFNRKVGCFISK